jgi:hypothetical protein
MVSRLAAGAGLWGLLQKRKPSSWPGFLPIMVCGPLSESFLGSSHGIQVAATDLRNREVKWALLALPVRPAKNRRNPAWDFCETCQESFRRGLDAVLDMVSVRCCSLVGPGLTLEGITGI